MSRIRTIKPEWLDDEEIVLLGSDARTLSVALIILADDYGNGRANLLLLRSRVFPVSDQSVLDSALSELERARFVELYELDGQSYFHIRNWNKHQRVDKPGKPRVPSPPELSRKPRERPKKHPADVAKVPSILAPDLYHDQDHDQDHEEESADALAADAAPPGDVSERFISEVVAKPRLASVPKPDPVFAHWVTVMGKDETRTRLNAARKAKLRARRLEGYSDEQLCVAVDGCKLSSWHMGQNDKGEVYNDLATILRDGTTVEKHIERVTQAPRRDVRKGFVDPAPASAFTNPTDLDRIFGPEKPAAGSNA